MSKNTLATHMARVHAVICCQDCNFKAKWFLNAVEKAEEHHRQTGHELTGDMVLGVWIGDEGRKRNRRLEDDMDDSLSGTKTESGQSETTPA